MLDKSSISPARLKRWQFWLFALSGGALWASGSTWLLLYYFLRHQGEYGAEVHPLEPTMMQIHGAAMPLALLAVGSLLVLHIPKGWSYRRQRIFGALMVACLSVLVITSYILNYGDEELREWASIVHWVTGLGLPGIFLTHWLKARALRT